MGKLQDFKDKGVKQLTVKNGEAKAVNPHEKLFVQYGAKSHTHYLNPEWEMFDLRNLPPLLCPSVEDGVYEIERFDERFRPDIASTKEISSVLVPHLILKEHGEEAFNKEMDRADALIENIFRGDFDPDRVRAYVEGYPNNNLASRAVLEPIEGGNYEFQIKSALSEVITDLGKKDILLDQDEIVNAVYSVFKSFGFDDAKIKHPEPVERTVEVKPEGEEQPEQCPIKFSDLASYVLCDTINDAYIPLDDSDLYFHISGGKVNGVFYRSEEYYEGGGEIHDRETFDEIKSFKIQSKTLSAEQPEQTAEQIYYDLMQQIREKVANDLVGMNWIDFKKSILFYRFHEEATDRIAAEYAALKVRQATDKV